MSNNSTLLAKVKDILPQEKLMAAAEILQVINNHKLCSMLNLTETSSSPDDKIITGHKVGVLAHLIKNKRGEWRCAPDSLMTLVEVNKYVNAKFVQKAIASERMGVFRKSNDEESPDGIIPAKVALEICLRKTEFHGLIKKYLDNGISDISIHTEEVDKLLYELKGFGDKSMLRAFGDSLDNLENGIDVSLDTEFANYLREHPLGTDKIKNMLIGMIWVIEDESNRLRSSLGDPDISSADLAPLSRKLSSMGNRFTEVPRKFLQKTGMAGDYNTPMVLKAKRYFKDACNHPTYLRE